MTTPNAPDPTEFTTVAQEGEIPEGQGRAYALAGRMIAVFLRDGEYFAIDDFCPHAGASLAGGFMDGHEVSCPWHAWRFDVRDGTWCDNRRLKVDRFEVRVQNGDVQVRPTPAPLEEPEN